MPKFIKRAGCYHHCGKPARPGRRFCSDRCAAEFAEEISIGNEDAWCVTCQTWNTKDMCSHPKLKEPGA